MGYAHIPLLYAHRNVGVGQEILFVADLMADANAVAAPLPSESMAVS